jgi:GNAT superfamily N-acetyltransferase
MFIKKLLLYLEKDIIAVFFCLEFIDKEVFILKATLLKAGEEKYFKGLITEKLFEKIKLPNMQLIGVTTEEDGADVPIGVVVFSGVPMDTFVIEWIYIDPEYRGRGIGTSLVRNVINLAKDNDAPCIAAKFSDLIPVEEDKGDLIRYFEDLGLINADYRNDEWVLDGKQITTEPFIMKAIEKRSKSNDVVNLSDTSEEEIMSSLVHMAEVGRVMQLFSPHGRLDFYDPKYSFKLVKKDKIKGLLLVHMEGHVIIPVTIAVEDVRDLGHFLRGIARLTAKKINETESLNIICNSKNAMKIASVVFKNVQPVETEYRYCDIKDLEILSEPKEKVELNSGKSFFIEDYPTEGYEYIEDLYYTREW